MPAQLIIVDDHQLLRQSLVRLLRMSDRVEVVGEAASGSEALQLVESLRPEVALVDIKLPDMSGIEVTALIKKAHPEVSVVIVTMFADEDHATDALRVGANAFLSKNVSLETLLQAIETVRGGGSFIESSIAQHLFRRLAPWERSEVGVLTPQERTILSLLAEGCTNADVAKRLFLSEKTIKQYLSRLFTKLQVRDRTEAVAVAVRRGLVM